MSNDDKSWCRRRGYHHGHLREALIEVAERLILEKGPAGFTLVEAATRAGVSPAAPYRHFKNREALLAEVARAGFERFAERLETAWDGGRPDALAAFRRMGKVYLDFARYERASYVAMFEADIGDHATPQLMAVSERAFAALTRAAAALGGRMPDGSAPDPQMLGAHIWALSHGIATLFGSGRAAGKMSDDELYQLFDTGVLVYLRGLGIGI
jgi:AcrR family transcriptional regulator